LKLKVGIRRDEFKMSQVAFLVKFIVVVLMKKAGLSQKVGHWEETHETGPNLSTSSRM
jgi:hypothetical protein